MQLQRWLRGKRIHVLTFAWLAVARLAFGVTFDIAVRQRLAVARKLRQYRRLLRRARHLRRRHARAIGGLFVGVGDAGAFAE